MQLGRLTHLRRLHMWRVYMLAIALLRLRLVVMLLLVLDLRLAVCWMSQVVSLGRRRRLSRCQLSGLRRWLRDRRLGDSSLVLLDVLRRYRVLSRARRRARLVVYLRGGDGTVVELRGRLL